MPSVEWCQGSLLGGCWCGELVMASCSWAESVMDYRSYRAFFAGF
jgi:hypothetical protein